MPIKWLPEFWPLGYDEQLMLIIPVVGRYRMQDSVTLADGEGAPLEGRALSLEGSWTLAVLSRTEAPQVIMFVYEHDDFNFGNKPLFAYTNNEDDELVFYQRAPLYTRIMDLFISIEELMMRYFARILKFFAFI
jgi:hypothetical protein